jgi:hypothetical protein
MRIVATQQTHAAGQLAETAAGAQVKIGFDEKVVGHGHSGCPPTQTEAHQFASEQETGGPACTSPPDMAPIF